jgi:hypothetical protein
MKKNRGGGRLPIISNPTKLKVLSALFQHLCEDEDGLMACEALREALIAKLRTMDARYREMVFRGFDDGALAWELKNGRTVG